jgi:hypothetical protein
MNLLKQLAALLVILALGGCAPAPSGQGQTPATPYSHDSGPDMRSGGDGGGGGM